MKLTDVKAIVTGGAGGLGGCFVLELARMGAGLPTETQCRRAAQTRSKAEDLLGRVFVARLDITDETSAMEFVETATEYMEGQRPSEQRGHCSRQPSDPAG